MKKIVSFFMALILFTSSASAEAIRTDDRTKFEQGIELVRQISDPKSLESAVDIFASITSGYTALAAVDHITISFTANSMKHLCARGDMLRNKNQHKLHPDAPVCTKMHPD